MAWRLVVQPNGLYARYSDVVDDFTDYDMTRDEAFTLCRDAGGVDVANYKLGTADAAADRFRESISLIRAVHGAATAMERRAELSQTPVQETDNQ